MSTGLVVVRVENRELEKAKKIIQRQVQGGVQVSIISENIVCKVILTFSAESLLIYICEIERYK